MGFAVITTTVDSVYMLELHVRSPWCRAGLATRLVESVKARAARDGSGCVTLTVNKENNPAINLYESTGFQPKKPATPGEAVRAAMQAYLIMEYVPQEE